MSSNIVSIAVHKNIVPCYLSGSPLFNNSHSPEPFKFHYQTHIHCQKHYFPTSLPYGALLTVIFSTFGVDCSNEPSYSSLKPFDKLFMAKSLCQSGRSPLVQDFDS